MQVRGRVLDIGVLVLAGTRLRREHPAERLRMKNDFALVQRWARAQDRPILLGEFGAYDKGDMASRAAYTAAAAREAESHGWAWTYWQFDGDSALPEGMSADLVRKIMIDNPHATYPRLKQVATA